VALCAVLLLPAVIVAEEAPAASADEERAAVMTAHRDLLTAYATADIDALAGLMNPSEDLLIYHPRGNLQFKSLPSVRHGLERMLNRVGPLTWSDERNNHVVVSGDVAWHTYELGMAWSGDVDPIDVRGTEIWLQRAGGWRLVHAHWSESTPTSHPSGE